MTKRSKGVTFWGWCMIVMGGLGVNLGVQNFTNDIRVYGYFLTALTFSLSIASIFYGFFILRLKNFARKAAIVLAIINLMLAPLILVFAIRSSEVKGSPIETEYAQQRQTIIEQTKPEHLEAALKKFDEELKMGKKIGAGLVLIFFMLPFAVLEIVRIYFLTRPKIKEQFGIQAASGTASGVF